MGRWFKAAMAVATGLVLLTFCGGASAAENIGGIWRTSWVDMMLSQGTDGTVQGAFGPGASGRVSGILSERAGGGELVGRWSADTPPRKCSKPRDGDVYWGEVVIVFSGDKLRGSRNECNGSDIAFEGRRLSILPLDADLGLKPLVADASPGAEPTTDANEKVAASTPDAVAPDAVVPEAATQAAAEPQTTTKPQAANEPVATTADKAAEAKPQAPAGQATAPANGQRKTPPPPPFRGGEYAYLERFMPLRGEFALPMFRGDNPRVWSVAEDEKYPYYEPQNPKTGYETLTWRYTALVEGTIDEEGKDLYETYISIARGDAAAIEQEFAAHRTELEARFKAGDKTGELAGIKRIDDFEFGQGGYILVRGDRQDMHEIRYRDNGLLITVRCSPWFGGMDYCPFVGAEVNRKITKVRKAEGK